MRHLWVTAVLASGVIAGAAACSSGPSLAARQFAAEKQTCQVLKGATAIQNQSSSAGFTMIAQAQVLISQAKPGVMSPQFIRDVRAVTAASHEPSPGEVAVLTADCASLGVKGRIWPSDLTNNGN